MMNKPDMSNAGDSMEWCLFTLLCSGVDYYYN